MEQQAFPKQCSCLSDYQAAIKTTNQQWGGFLWRVALETLLRSWRKTWTEMVKWHEETVENINCGEWEMKAGLPTAADRLN